MKKNALAIGLLMLIPITGIFLIVSGLVSQAFGTSIIVTLMLLVLMRATVRERGSIKNQSGQACIKPGPYVLCGAWACGLGAFLFGFILVMVLLTEQDVFVLALVLSLFILLFLFSFGYLLLAYRRSRIYYDANRIRYVTPTRRVIECGWEDVLSVKSAKIITKQGVIRYDWSWKGYRDFEDFLAGRLALREDA
ncbi:MAG: hypothetical protein RRY21_03970 [Oscillospiraceae bacterium]